MDAQGFIQAAVARSFRNMGDVAASEPELLGVLSRLFAGYYGVAASGNPAVLGRRAVVAWDVGGFWPAPSDQYVLYQLTWNGLPVVVVPFNDPQADVSVPAVYRLGSKYYPAGNANDPQNVALTFVYQPVPPAFTTLASVPSDDWPEQFDEMVIVDLATYLAEKDARPEDIQSMQNESGKWQGLYSEWLGLADTNTVRRFSVPTQVPTPNVVPVGVHK